MSTDDGVLTILTANLKNPYFSSLRVNHAWHLARLEAFAGLVEAAGAGIVLCQEVGRGRDFRVDEWLSGRLGMEVVYAWANGSAGRYGREEGLAIFSRYPLREAQTALLAGGLWRRPALGAVAITPWGALAVYTTHHSLRPWRNRRQPAHLMAWVATTAGARTAIVGGDFNAGEGAPHSRSLASTWVDSYRAANPAAGGGTRAVRLLGRVVARPRLDRLYLRPGTMKIRIVECYNASSSPMPFSDHLAVVAHFALKGEETADFAD